MMQDKIKIEKLSDQVFYSHTNHKCDQPILGAIVGSSAVLMVDAGGHEEYLRQFLNFLKERNAPENVLLVLTHWHWDHVFGLAGYGNQIIAHSLTFARLNLLKQMALNSTDEKCWEKLGSQEEAHSYLLDLARCHVAWRDYGHIPLPDVLFDDSLEIDLGGVRCRIERVGGDHSEDSCVVRALDSEVVFLGDALYRSWGAEKRYSRKRLPDLIKRLVAYNAGTYLLAHEPTPLNLDHLLHWQNVVQKIKALDAEGGNVNFETLRKSNIIENATEQFFLELMGPIYD